MAKVPCAVSSLASASGSSLGGMCGVTLGSVRPVAISMIAATLPGFMMVPPHGIRDAEASGN